MKLMICSDIHGSAKYAEFIKQTFIKENADKLLLLGDVYYHGPRNTLPEDYNPKKDAEIFNEMTDKLIVIKGNCDAEVDQMISKFHFVEQSVIMIDGKTIFASHGHVYNMDNLPAGKYDAILYGHFHKTLLANCNGTVFLNPGSISLPKDDIRAYAIYNDGKFVLKNLDNKIILELSI